MRPSKSFNFPFKHSLKKASPQIRPFIFPLTLTEGLFFFYLSTSLTPNFCWNSFEYWFSFAAHLHLESAMFNFNWTVTHLTFNCTNYKLYIKDTSDKNTSLLKCSESFYSINIKYKFFRSVYKSLSWSKPQPILYYSPTFLSDL